MGEPMVFVSERQLSASEFWSWVETRQDDQRYELIGGHIIMNPPSSWPEGEAEGEALGTLRAFVKAHDLGRTFTSAQGIELPGGDVVAPDVSFVSHERWRAGPRPEAGQPLRIVPDLVVEVVAPSSAARDRGPKLDLYARAGVREYWLLDARRREVTVFLAAGAGRFDDGRTHVEADAFVCHALPGFTVRVRDLLPAP